MGIIKNTIMAIDFKHFINSYHFASSYEQAIKELFDDFPEKEKFDFLFLEFPKLCIKSIKENTSFNNHLFQLLNFYEYRFIELVKKERYPTAYYQIYYCFYWIFQKWSDKLEQNDKEWIQKKWLTVCFNSLSDKALRHWLESKVIDPDSPIDIEENVRDILFDEEGNLREEFKDSNNEMRFYASRAIDWFLKRYDRTTARKILKSVDTLYKNKFERAKLIAPRLWGAIFIGFLPLIMGQETWDLPSKLGWCSVLCLSISFFAITILYLAYECYNIIGFKEEALRRALKVGSYGLLVSGIYSFLICLTIGSKSIVEIYSKNYFSLMPEVGIPFANNIIFFASAALLIGIFIQVFWEEKTITEPL